MLVFIFLLGVYACAKDGSEDDVDNGDNGVTGAEALLSWWLDNIYGSERNMTIEIYLDRDDEPVLSNVYKHDGREGSAQIYSEELGDSMTYYVVEDGQLYSYYITPEATRYVRSVKSSELDIWFFGDEQTLSYAWFNVSGQTCDLKPAHIQELLGTSIYSGFQITVSETALTLTYQYAADGAGKLIVVFKDVGTTVLEFPDFGDYISW